MAVSYPKTSLMEVQFNKQIDASKLVLIPGKYWVFSEVVCIPFFLEFRESELFKVTLGKNLWFPGF